ncbi:MAG: oxygenase MpaB family protein [Solirubrobacterales bacterium]
MTHGDDGYFPRGRSVLRRIHSHRAVGLLFGQRALMIGALNPLAFTGTLEHTGGRLKPFARLAHTGSVFETIFFGTRAEADKALEWVHGLHERVRGELAEDAGVTPAGSRYSAFDPPLMLWTMAVIADSAPYFYELLVRGLDDEEREALWQDYVLFAELFGMPRDAAPRTHREFREYWDERMASDELHLTEDARHIGYATAFEIPMPAYYAPAKRLHDLIMLGSLPARVRELYGLGWTSAHAIAFRAAVTTLHRTRPLVPAVIRRGGNRASFDLVARTERERIARGEPTPQAPPAVSARQA